MATAPVAIIQGLNETKRSMLKEAKAVEKQQGWSAFPENIRKGEERDKLKGYISPSNNSSVKLVLSVFELGKKRKFWTGWSQKSLNSLLVGAVRWKPICF